MTRTELIQKYPYLDKYVSCGWYKLLDQLFSYIESIINKDEIEIKQIKNKFGSLRIYLNYKPSVIPDTRDLIDKKIGLIERASHEACEECGELGRLTNLGGFYTCRCQNCK